ncbi:MAG TPA: hypothetical protein VM101_03205 [Flavitalea sp.]|nr:hypothetical protein [Flavitalea sp.]
MVSSIAMKIQFIVALLLTLTACGQTSDKSQKGIGGKTVENKETKSMGNYSPSIDNAHPNAKRLMNEEFYWSPVEETAPFGSDDGADTYSFFAHWRQANKTGNPKDFLIAHIGYWGYPLFDLSETDFEKLQPYLSQSSIGYRRLSGIDAAIAAIAFGQLYLEGTIDKDFKELAKISIKRELIPELLNLWGDSYKATREMQLKKMLAVLNQVD